MSCFPCGFYRGSSSEQHIFLDAIRDTLDYILYHRTMVALRFVVTKTHHTPMFVNRVPTNFDNAVIDLFAIGLHTGKVSNYSSKNTLYAARDTPLPLFIIDMHYVPGFIICFRTLTPTPNVERKDRFCVQIRLL